MLFDAKRDMRHESSVRHGSVSVLWQQGRPKVVPTLRKTGDQRAMFGVVGVVTKRLD